MWCVFSLNIFHPVLADSTNTKPLGAVEGQQHLSHNNAGMLGESTKLKVKIPQSVLTLGQWAPGLLMRHRAGLPVPTLKWGGAPWFALTHKLWTEMRASISHPLSSTGWDRLWSTISRLLTDKPSLCIPWLIFLWLLKRPDHITVDTSSYDFGIWLLIFFK